MSVNLMIRGRRALILAKAVAAWLPTDRRRVSPGSM